MSDTDATTYGIEIEPADVDTGDRYWHAVEVHHLTPEENQNRNILILDLLDQTGDRVFGGRLRVTAGDETREVTVEQPPDAPGPTLSLERDKRYTVQALGLPGESLQTDTVVGVRTDHPDEAPGNELFHHSFAVTFQRTTAGAELPSTPTPSDEPADTAPPMGEQPTSPTPAEPVSEETLGQYILLGDPRRTQTRALLRMFAPLMVQVGEETVFGFHVEEAHRAREVLILATEDDIIPETEQELRTDTRTVQRALPREWDTVHKIVTEFLDTSQ